MPTWMSTHATGTHDSEANHKARTKTIQEINMEEQKKQCCN